MVNDECGMHIPNSSFIIHHLKGFAMDKIRIGIVGCGNMSHTHVNRFEELYDRMQITAAVDVVAEYAQKTAAALPGEVKAATDFHDVLPMVDALLLVLPHHLHFPVTMDCLKAGKHVLVEKPMANTEQECLDMIACAKETQRVLMVAYCMRFHPLVIKFRELIRSEAYGPVFQLSIWTEQLTKFEPTHWACRKETVGGGQLFSHGCHYIDLMLWMLNKNPVKGCHFGTNRGTPWMEREGTSNVVIEFEDGILGYHFGTWGARGTRNKYAFHAHCEKGMLELAFSDGKLILHSGKEHVPGQFDADNKEKILAEDANNKATEKEMEHFLQCIKTGGKPLTSGESSLAGLRLVWRLYDAEDKGAIADLRGIELPQ